MGNCQASEAATIVIQHPGGRVERLYWPTNAADIMKNNPGHYVALVTMYFPQDDDKHGGGGEAAAAGVRLTRVRLLKPKDILLLGQVYRVISSQEVAKALRARKHEKIRKSQAELIKKQQQQLMKSRDDEVIAADRQADGKKIDEMAMQQRDRQRLVHSGSRARHWRPSLQSISEAVS